MDTDERREYMKRYFVEHGHKYRRANVLRTAAARGRLPMKRSIERYGYTEEELRTVFDTIVRSTIPSK